MRVVVESRSLSVLVAEAVIVIVAVVAAVVIVKAAARISAEQ